MITATQSLSDDMIELFAVEVGAEVLLVDPGQEQEVELQGMLAYDDADDDEEALRPRPPIITVMGHVDHGKTCCSTSASQRGARSRRHHPAHRRLPGARRPADHLPRHPRSRGLHRYAGPRSRRHRHRVLVVAADDGVMPQTVEAINHAKAAGVPIVVAINKMDLRTQPRPQDPAARREGPRARGIGRRHDHGRGLPPSRTWAWTSCSSSCWSRPKSRSWCPTLLGAPGASSSKPAWTRAGARSRRCWWSGASSGWATPSSPVPLRAGSGRCSTTRAATSRRRPVDPRAGARPVRRAPCRRRLPGRAQRQDRQDGRRRRPGPADPLRRAAQEQLGHRLRRQARGHLRADPAGREGHPEPHPQGRRARLAGGAHREPAQARKRGGPAGVPAAGRRWHHRERRAAGVGLERHDHRLQRPARPQLPQPQLAELNDVEIRTYQIIYQVLEDIEKAMVGLLKPEFTEVVTGEAEVREVFRVPRVERGGGLYVRNGVITRGPRSASSGRASSSGRGRSRRCAGSRTTCARSQPASSAASACPTSRTSRAATSSRPTRSTRFLAADAVPW